MNTVMAATGFLTGYIVPFILVLSLLVFVHEMGHYLVGRWCGCLLYTSPSPRD